jgi:hypothetical protein
LLKDGIRRMVNNYSEPLEGRERIVANLEARAFNR